VRVMGFTQPSCLGTFTGRNGSQADAQDVGGIEEELCPNAKPGDGNRGDCTEIKLDNPARRAHLTGERSRTR
jgi:hypothetical protein